MLVHETIHDLANLFLREILSHQICRIECVLDPHADYELLRHLVLDPEIIDRHVLLFSKTLRVAIDLPVLAWANRFMSIETPKSFIRLCKPSATAAHLLTAKSLASLVLGAMLDCVKAQLFTVWLPRQHNPPEVDLRVSTCQESHDHQMH